VNSGTTGLNSLPKTVTRQRRGCDLNQGPFVPESSTLTTRLPGNHVLGGNLDPSSGRYLIERSLKVEDVELAILLLYELTVCLLQQDRELLLGSVRELVDKTFTHWQTLSVEDIELAITLLYQLAEALPVCCSLLRNILTVV